MGSAAVSGIGRERNAGLFLQTRSCAETRQRLGDELGAADGAGPGEKQGAPLRGKAAKVRSAPHAAEWVTV